MRSVRWFLACAALIVVFCAHWLTPRASENASPQMNCAGFKAAGIAGHRCVDAVTRTECWIIIGKATALDRVNGISCFPLR